jgi:hypothetical protein
MRKKRYKHQPFESRTEQGKFTKICNDMMESPAWESLNLRQRALYLELKSKFNVNKSSGMVISENSQNISMPKSEWSLLYGDYRTFKADMDWLIELGFVKLVQSGKTTRTCNIYGLIGDWKTITAVKPRHEIYKGFRKSQQSKRNKAKKGNITQFPNKTGCL